MTPPVRGPRYQSLDVWRGILCLVVVLEHAGIVVAPGALDSSGPAAWFHGAFLRLLSLNLGAPLFFVISGYCIAASLEGIRRRGDHPGQFLWRRLWRIFPPYWASIILLALVVFALDGLGLTRLRNSGYAFSIDAPGGLGTAQWFGNLTLTETWRPRVWGGSPTNIFTRVAWSLCYQEQFYLITVLALLLAPRRLFRGFALATAAIVSVRVLAWDCGALYRLEGFFPDLWHEFAVGLAVYWRLNVPASRMAHRAVEGVLAVLGLSALSCGLVTTTASAAFGLLLIALRPLDARIASLTALGSLRALGRRSYSIYLCHLPACVLVGAGLTDLGLTSLAARAFLVVPTALTSALALGWVFHHAVDVHFHTPPQLPRLQGVFTPRRPLATSEPVAAGSLAAY